ncbi:subtilisin-like protein [Lophiostoma macrostomum CBS 122681]|uniref:Subtilisin-like protein n=1 Tax=Lophiostoma macrostomum CBS 122681 TaxID=1314788 RepID=A0A6A6SZK4_9PLEO|nr:subtilisin-like protein [Lophiostoma macrostomum CBS 122681]
MKLPLLLLAIGVIGSTALPNQRRATPCTYHKGGSAREPLLEDQYTVELNDGYTLEEHYEFVGFNLSAAASIFSYRNYSNTYGIKIDEHTMHNIIRYDPGVDRVTHNMVLSSQKTWYKQYPVTDTHKHDAPYKRWSSMGGTYHWSTGHINEWDRSIDYEKEFYHTRMLEPAGKGVDVYILDSGIITWHEIWRRHGNCRDLRNGKQYTDEMPYQNCFHGTAVGGVVSLNAPWATIVSAKVHGQGGNYDRMTEALNDILEDHEQYKRDHPDTYKGAVINMSFGSEDHPPLQKIMARCTYAGIPIVTSAGNDGNPYGSKPCGWENVICIGAIDKNFNKSSFSDYGKYVDMYAPGEHIYTAFSSGWDEYIYVDGTSVAAPMVSAVLAGFIGYEGINNNVTKAYLRLVQNWHQGVLTNAQPNTLLHSGHAHPNKDRSCPYNGPTGCTDEEADEEVDTHFTGNGPDAPSTFLPDLYAGPASPPNNAPNPPPSTPSSAPSASSTAACPAGCKCTLGLPPLCT